MSILKTVENRIKSTNELLERLSLIKIDGVSKLTNKFKQELNFLRKCIAREDVKEEHLVCSNLTHLEALAKQLLINESSCTSVMSAKFLRTDSGAIKKICVDLVLQGGSVWMKVIARNKRALTLVSKGECSFGQRSIVDQAREFVRCSRQNIIYFQPPTVVFYFVNGVDDGLADDITNTGVTVEQDFSDPTTRSLFPLSEPQEYKEKPKAENINTIKDVAIIYELGITRLNLGVTTMIAYVSALTNGGCNKRFQSEVLKKHANWERARPVKPLLDALFEGKHLFCCRTAARDFQGIVNMLGGPGEQARSAEFMKRVTVVEDCPSKRLRPGGKIKQRSIAIFGTGESLRAITVTANNAFVRSARNRGVTFEVFVHESRALTEGKQLP